MSSIAEDNLNTANVPAIAVAPRRCIVMLATSARTMGGISAVINSYRSAGLFERWPIVHVETHCDGSTWEKALMALRAQWQFWKLLITRRIAVVHIHGASDASFWRKSSFAVVALIAGVPLIYHLHGGGFMHFYARRRGAVRRWLIRFIFDRASAVVVLSDEWRRRIQGLTRNRSIHVVANPIDPALLQYERLAAPSRTVLFVGRLVEQKGVLDLVEAFAAFHREHSDWRLQFAGQGDIEAIRTRARELGVEDHIDFLGWVTGAEKLKYLAHAGIFVLPSWVEGLPMSILEAMAMGLPIVATRVGAVPEVIEQDVSGKLVEPRTPTALADALVDLARDEKKRHALGARAQAAVTAQFGPGEVLPRVEAIYANLGAQSRADRAF